MVSKLRVFGLCSAAAFGLAAGAAFAQSAGDAQPASDPPESPFHALARVTGFATTPPPPADFVRESRPDAPTGWSPIFKPYEEPGSKVKSKDDLKAMGDDLQKTGETSDKLRADAEATATPTPTPTPTAAAKPPRKTASPKPTPSATSQN
jgi:hypothetical protein